MKVRIVILPPSDINRNIISVARKAHEISKSLFFLNGKDFVPHITLCRFEIDKKSIPDLQKDLKVLLINQKELVLNFYKFSLVNDGVNNGSEDDHSLYLDLKGGQKLAKLRRNIFDLSKKYNTEAKYAKLKVFRPHVTLARFGNRKTALKAGLAIDWSHPQFTASTIALTNSIEFGQVSKVIKKFSLK